jgi:hypothetical protein
MLGACECPPPGQTHGFVEHRLATISASIFEEKIIAVDAVWRAGVPDAVIVADEPAGPLFLRWIVADFLGADPHAIFSGNVGEIAVLSIGRRDQIAAPLNLEIAFTLDRASRRRGESGDRKQRSGWDQGFTHHHSPSAFVDTAFGGCGAAHL